MQTNIHGSTNHDAALCTSHSNPPAGHLEKVLLLSRWKGVQGRSNASCLSSLDWGCILRHKNKQLLSPYSFPTALMAHSEWPVLVELWSSALSGERGFCSRHTEQQGARQNANWAIKSSPPPTPLFLYRNVNIERRLGVRSWQAHH